MGVKAVKVKSKKDGAELLAWQWDGQNFQPEEFETFGFFEDDNGYDLDDCTEDFVLEEGRRKGLLRCDEWVIKSELEGYALVSRQWFAENMEVKL